MHFVRLCHMTKLMYQLSSNVSSIKVPNAVADLLLALCVLLELRASYFATCFWEWFAK